MNPYVHFKLRKPKCCNPKCASQTQNPKRQTSKARKNESPNSLNPANSNQIQDTDTLIVATLNDTELF